MDYGEILYHLRCLQAAGVKYVMVGATAMGVHGLARATEGVDLLLQANATNIERLRAALREAYPEDTSVDEIRNQDPLGDYAVVRYYPPSGSYHFDFIAKLGEAATFESVEAETKDIEGISVRVATPGELCRLKKDTIRAIDRRDAMALQRRFNLEEKR